MFSPEERDGLRDVLVAAARRDDRITGAASTGSASVGRTDRWSDIDLALGVSAKADPADVLADWTRSMYGEHGALHHMDLVRGSVVYRVFLLASTLQVDVAFAPAAQFGATAPTFRLLFGTAADLDPFREVDPVAGIGMGWLYALHARSSLARGRVWQAEYMINGMRNEVVALACLRHGLPSHDGRGVDGSRRR